MNNTLTDDGIKRAGVAVALFIARLAMAADYTWTGASNASWNESDANWIGAGEVWANGAASHATLGDSTAKTVAADAVTLGNLTFTADGYTIGGGPLLMHGTPTVGTGLTATLTAPVTNVGVWAKGGEGTLVLNPEGAVSNVFYALKAATGTVVVAGGTNLVTQAGSLPESGPAFWVSGGTLVVGGGLLKTTGGAYARVSEYGHLWVTNGLCDLSGNSELLNAFNTPGWTTVEGGGVLEVQRVRIVKNQSGAQYSGVNINTGGTVRLNSFWFEPAAQRRATVNLNGGKIVGRSGSSGQDMLGGTDPYWSNIVVNVLAGGAVFDNNGYGFYVRQPLLGAPGDGGLTKLNNGTFHLWGTNSYHGATRVGGGTLNLIGDRGLGVVPASPETNLWFLGSSTLQSSANHALDANRTLWITNGAQVVFDPQSYTQTIHGVILCADTNAAAVKSGSGSGWVIFDPGDAATNIYGTLQCAAGNIEIRSGTHLVTYRNTGQREPGLRVNGGTMLVSGGLLKTTQLMYVNVDGGHLLVTNGVVDTTSCNEILNGIGSTHGYTTVGGSGVIIANQVRISQSVQPFTNIVVSVNTGGVLRLNNFYIDVGANQRGMLVLNGGTLEARQNTDNFLGTTAVVTGGNNDKWLTNIIVEVREGGAVFDTAGRNISVKQPLVSGATADGGLAKRGAGMLTLLNTNTYNGVTVVADGTLRFGRDDVLPAANTAMASSNAVLDVNGKSQTLAGLGGSGTVSNLAVLAVTGTLAPGDADGFGTLTLAGGPASMAGCTLSVNVSSDGACDRLHVLGDLDLTALTLHVEDAAQLNRFKRYTVASCTGALTAPFASLGTLPPRWVVKTDATGKAVYLVYDFGTQISLR